MTGRELITASLRLIGAAAPGESIEASEATDGLATLNRMISSWSNEELMIYAEVRDQFTLTPGTASYTFGASGSFNSSRPQTIYRAFLRNETQSPAVEYPVNILNLDQWSSIVSKDATSEIVTDLYSDGAYPQTNIKLYPIPTAAHKLVIYSSKVLGSISTIDSSVSFPPGFEEALISSLALRLAPEYGKVVSDDVRAMANSSLSNIKAKNLKPIYLKCDPAMVGASSFNIYTGGPS